MDLDRVVDDILGPLVKKRFRRGSKKSKIGHGRSEAVFRAVLLQHLRRSLDQATLPVHAPRVRLTTAAVFEHRAALGLPTLTQAQASNALYEWAIVLKKPVSLDADAGSAIVRVTLHLHHDRGSGSFDLALAMHRDTAEAKAAEPVLESTSAVCELDALFASDARPEVSSSRPNAEREVGIQELVRLVPQEHRPRVDGMLRSLPATRFASLLRDISAVKRIRPTWAAWILLGIAGALSAYFGSRYVVSLSVPHPLQFASAQPVQLLPDGTLLLRNGGLRTHVIQNSATGERIAVWPTSKDGVVRLSMNGVLNKRDVAHIETVVAPWNRVEPSALIVYPVRTVAEALQIVPTPPIPPTLVFAETIPHQDAALADEIRRGSARCTVLFGKSGHLDMAPPTASIETDVDGHRVYGWAASYEYRREEGRYDVKMRVTRADGRIEHYTRTIFVHPSGVAPWMGEESGAVKLRLPPENSGGVVPFFVGTLPSDCCFVDEPVKVDADAFVTRLISLRPRDVAQARFYVKWNKEEDQPDPVPLFQDGRFVLPPHTYRSVGVHEVELLADWGAGDQSATHFILDVRPQRLH